MRVHDQLLHLLAGLTIACAALAVIVQAVWFDRTSSITFDETFYANCAIKTVETGFLDNRFADYGVAPLPVLLSYGLPALFASAQSEADPFRGNLGHCRIVSAARVINSLISGVGLVVLTATWLWSRIGSVGGAIGGILLAASPALLSHAALATTDAPFALSAMLALAALGWYRANPPTAFRFLVLAAGIGIAFSMKYSGVFLLPVAVVTMGYDRFVEATGGLLRRSLRTLLLSLGTAVLLSYCAFLFAWAFHGFGISEPRESLARSDLQQPRESRISRLSLPTPMTGVLAQIRHNRLGHPAFLMGERSTTGWRSYYPWAIVLKSTPIEMLLALGTFVAGAIALCSKHDVAFSDKTRQVWGIGAIIYLMLLVLSRIDIGHRYTLPLYPLLVLTSVDVLWSIAGASSKSKLTLLVALAACQLITSFAVGPDKLSYFTPFVGGPRQGYRFLVDSNLDWGQDLPRLKTSLERLGCDRVLLAYFGTARPEAYGIEATDWSSVEAPDRADCGVLAVSATKLQGAYAARQDPFAPLRPIEPIARAGNSIFLYDLRDPKVLEAVKKCREREVARF